MKEFGQWLLDILLDLGPLGVFAVSLLDSAFIPMPQGVDALLIAQSIAAPETAYLSAALAILGSLLGSLFLYGVAKKGGRVVLERKVSKVGASHLQRQIDQFGALVLIPVTVIPLPMPMKPVVLASGAFQLKISHFIAALVLSRSVRYFGEAHIAVLYGDQTTTFIKDHFLAAIAICLVLIVMFYAVNRWSTRRVNEG